MIMSREEYKLCEEKAISLLKEYGIEKPFVDVAYVAARKGLQIKIVKMPEKYKDVAGFLDVESKTIYVNNEDPANRQTFTIAHELGHFVLKHDPGQVGVLLRLPVPGDQKTAIEKEADVFAANLLVPKKMLLQTMKEYDLTSDQVDILARIFAVSRMTMMYRFKWLGLEKYGNYRW